MPKTIYTHTHHIIPRHAGGSDDASNKIRLTVEEHALAHRKLFFIYGRWQDELAYLALEKQIGKEEATKTAREKGYDHWLNNGGRELIGHSKGGGRGSGWKMTEEQKQVLREYAQKQVRKPCSEATKEKLRQVRKKQVIIHSEETKEKIRQSLLRRNAKV